MLVIQYISTNLQHVMWLEMKLTMILLFIFHTNSHTYAQHRGTIGPAVAALPYEIKLCPPADYSVTGLHVL